MASKKKSNKKKTKAVVKEKEKKVVKKTAALVRTSPAVEKIRKSIADQFSGELIKVLSSKPKPITKGISWGCSSINLICTGHPFIGIIPGRIYEIFGPESSGKTTAILMAIAECQAAGGIAAFVDAEHALDTLYAKRLGVQLQDLLVSQPDCGEEALEITEALVESKSVDIIGIDSVAALTPRAEIEGAMGKAHMGLQARLMGQAMRKLVAKTAKSKTSLLFLNQTRQMIGVMFGSPETTTGGNALRFYASFRLRYSQIKDSKKRILGVEKKQVGIPHKVKCVKNKVHIPFGETVVKCYFGLGFDRVGDLYNLALEQNLISKSNKAGTYNIPGVGRISNLQEYVLVVEDLVRDYYAKKAESEDE